MSASRYFGLVGDAPNYPSPFVGLFSVAVIAFTCVVGYRLYFHPLARVPGPILASLTDYYVTYYDLVRDGDMVKQLERLHHRYGQCHSHLRFALCNADRIAPGPVVRFGPNKVRVNSSSSILHHRKLIVVPRFISRIRRHLILFTRTLGSPRIPGSMTLLGRLNHCSVVPIYPLRKNAPVCSDLSSRGRRFHSWRG